MSVTGSVVTATSKITVGLGRVNMNNFLSFLKQAYTELSPVLELLLYLIMAYAIHLTVGLTYIQSVGIIFVYFVLCLMRVLVENIVKRNR